MAEEDDLWKDVPEDLPQLLQTNILDEASDVFLAREHLLQNSQELLELMESGTATVFKKEEDYEREEERGGPPPKESSSFLAKLKVPHKLPLKIRSPFSGRKHKTRDVQVTPSDLNTPPPPCSASASSDVTPVAPRRTKPKSKKTISTLVASQARIQVSPSNPNPSHPPDLNSPSPPPPTPPSADSPREQYSVSSAERTGSIASTSSGDLESLPDSQDSQPTPPPRKSRQSQKVRLKDTKKKFQTVDADQLTSTSFTASRKPSSPTKAFSLPLTQSDSVCESLEFPHHDQLKRASEFGLFSKQREPFGSAAVVDDQAFENVSFSEEDHSLGELNRCIDSLENLPVTVSISEKTHLDNDLDSEDMDAESRKQELEKMRMRFFDKREAEAASNTTTAPLPLHDLYPTSTNIDFDSDGFYDSKSILNTDHKTTITISQPEDRHVEQTAQFDPMDIVQPDLQPLQRNSRYDDYDDREDEEELIIGASPPPQFAHHPTNKSKIVLDLDDFQYRPEFNSRPSAAHDESFSGRDDGMDFIFGSGDAPSYDGAPSHTHDSVTADLLGLDPPNPPPSRVLLDLNDDTPDPREILIEDTVAAPPPLRPQTTTQSRKLRALRNSEVDSDVSDNECTFQATFVPAAGVVEASDSEQDDSGIVLIAYSHATEDKTRQQPEDSGVNLLHSRPLANATDYPVNQRPPLPRSQPPQHLITADNQERTSAISSTADLASKHQPDSDFNLPQAPTPRPYSLRTTDATAPNKMDALTGLRKVGPPSPVDKAVEFVSRTEPLYRVKPKEEVAQISKELQHNRQEILDSSRVRARKVDSWGHGATWSDDSPVGEPPELPKQPSPPVPQPEIRAKITESELKYDERKKLKKMEKLLSPPSAGLHGSSALHIELEIDDNQQQQQHLEEEQNLYYEDVHSRSSKPKESAIEREIRLARERELELKHERQQQQQQQHNNNNNTMPIYKVPQNTQIRKTELPVNEDPGKQMYKELTEVDRDSEMLQRESIIEREIREQNEREQALRHTSIMDKEFEQSELERREKEQEHAQQESLVEREIRLQLQREAEVTPRRSVMTSPPSPQPIGHRPDQTSSVSYAHAGESLIARELREQKEREEELRSRWNAMGMDMPPVSDEPETPFQMPQPTMQQPFVHSAANGAGNSNNTNGVQQQQQTPAEEPVVKPPSPQPQTSVEGRSKVRPFEDPDENEQAPAFRYTPQNETPIDREIRMMNDREAALRESRGLPASAKVNDSEVAVEISPTRPHNLYRKGEEEVGRGAMKRLAHSNIQKEIAREKAKESDLQQLGRIKTLSVDQDKQPKYTDVITKEQLAGPPPSMRTPVQPKSPGFYAPTTPAAMHKTVYSPEIKAATATAASPIANNSHVNGRGAPVVNRLTPTSEDSKVHSGRSTTESKIDIELRELRDREEELKAQRRMLTNVQPPVPPGQKTNAPRSLTPLTPTSPKVPLDSLELHHRHATETVAHSPSSPAPTGSPQPGGGHQGSFTVRDSSNAFPGDKSVKSARRKSGLAAEWERKFGGGAN